MRITRSLATLAPAAALLATALANPLGTPAQAYDRSPATHRIDEDYVLVRSADGTGQVYEPHALAFLRRGRVEVQVHGGVHRTSTAPGCRSARVTFVYADESRETTRESARACRQYGATYKDLDFHPSKDKDVVRYTVSLLSATDLTAPASTVASRTYPVGDAPDSWGTAARLDHDAVELTHEGQRVFTEGAADWWIQREDIAGVTFRFARSRVTGTLTRPTWLAGEKAWLRVVWTYADGSTSTRLSAAVTKAAPTAAVNLTSDRYEEAVSLTIAVVSDWPAATAVVRRQLGDHWTP